MATLRFIDIARAAKNADPLIPKSTLKMLIATENGTTFIAPFAPQTIDYGERGVNFSEVGREGTYGVMRRVGMKTPVLSFSLTIAGPGTHGRMDITPWIETLDAIAESGQRISILYTAREQGTWLLTGYSLNVTHRNREHMPSRAEASLTFTRITNEAAYFGPVNGGSAVAVPPPPPPPAPSPGATPSSGGQSSSGGGGQTYVVKKGDTLWDLAQKFYRNPNKWPKIADANKIRNPKLLQIGTKLTIPKI